MVSFDNEHEAFADSRVLQYVYIQPKEKDFYFSRLDQHADTLEGDVKLPLVVLGSEGCGKSALLANWVAKRRDHIHKEEFLFQHFVGCSTASLQLSHTLQRLETALKNFFQLREMRVPETEEELRWGLNRFLAAAAKKHNPARIIIIIDGINRLKAEGATDGALHWLPTDLPPCVRFIVSTVEYERAIKGKADGSQHRTFVELTRRKCPTLRIDPLTVNTRHQAINLFVQRNQDVNLSENQQFRIVTAPVTSQPMYLRLLLQALRLTGSLTTYSVDDLLEIFLSCSSPNALFDKLLDTCQESLFPPSDEVAPSDNDDSELLGKVLSVIHASKSGLNESEIWGILRMVSKYAPSEDMARQVMTIVKEFTMEVKGLYSFSHENYKEVVYDKYMRSQDALIRWHLLLARFFGQLPPCERKLTAQPYHLEVAGSWSKVKNCLTEIEMFLYWWTPKFKHDFIKLWASLTRRSPLLEKEEHSSTRKKDTKKSKDDSLELTGAQKPTYDVVEEYVKSVDEFRTRTHPSDERLADVILKIADFLLEFATLGHESFADVPPNVHPVIPAEDLKAIGVPHIVVDDEGRSSLVVPSIFPQSGHSQEGGDGADSGVGSNAGAKALEDIPIATTYFFARWMWIQFPFIALGNCNNRYKEGIEKFQEMMQDNRNKKLKAEEEEKDPGVVKKTIKMRDDSRTGNPNAFKLPEIKFNRKAARSHSRVNKEVADDAQASADKFSQRMDALQDDIQNYREEHDFVMQMKIGLTKRLATLKGSLVELQRSEESMSQFDGDLDDVFKREKEAVKAYALSREAYKNLSDLHTMCNRHPAKMPALITEVEAKVEQDVFLLAEIKKRLWEQKFERNTHITNFRRMKQLVAQGANMYGKLLDIRWAMKRKLQDQADEAGADDEKILGAMQAVDKVAVKKTSKGSRGYESSKQAAASEMSISQDASWDEKWAVISDRTGIIEPDIFFSRIGNRGNLEEQINTLQKVSEQKLEALKNETTRTEQEVEDARYEMSIAGGLDEEAKEKTLLLRQREHDLKNIKERSETSQQLVQSVASGLRHIGHILGFSGEESMEVVDVIREVETVLDLLMEEREKQLQAQNQSSLDNSVRIMGTTRESTQSPETHFRSPELELALSKIEHPHVRKPSKLPSRPVESVVSARADEDDDDNDEGMWDRTFVKNQAEKSFRLNRKKAAPINTTVTVTVE